MMQTKDGILFSMPQPLSYNFKSCGTVFLETKRDSSPQQYPKVFLRKLKLTQGDQKKIGWLKKLS